MNLLLEPAEEYTDLLYPPLMLRTQKIGIFNRFL